MVDAEHGWKMRTMMTEHVSPGLSVRYSFSPPCVCGLTWLRENIMTIPPRDYRKVNTGEGEVRKSCVSRSSSAHWLG